MCALEAMALGTPVVSTPTDGMKDITNHGINGYLCDTDEQLAQAVLNIVEDPTHRQALGQQAKADFARMNDEEKYNETIYSSYC